MNVAPQKDGLFDKRTQAELDFADQVASLFSGGTTGEPGGGNNPAKLIFRFIAFLMGWLSVTLEVFIRHDFGERYLGWLRLIFSLATLGPFLLLPAMLGVAPPLALILWAAAYILGYIHRLVIWRRNMKGEQWHPDSFGISWLWPLVTLPHRIPTDAAPLRFIRAHFTDWTLFRWVEPIFFLLLANVLGRFSSMVGFWMTTASIAMLLQHNIIFYQRRDEYLIAIGNMIKARYWPEVLKVGHARQMKGYHAIPASPKEREILARLSQRARPAANAAPAPAPTPSLAPAPHMTQARVEAAPTTTEDPFEAEIAATVRETIGGNGFIPYMPTFNESEQPANQPQAKRRGRPRKDQQPPSNNHITGPLSEEMLRA
jgi:hypothetical protein